MCPERSDTLFCWIAVFREEPADHPSRALFGNGASSLSELAGDADVVRFVRFNPSFPLSVCFAQLGHDNAAENEDDQYRHR